MIELTSVSLLRFFPNGCEDPLSVIEEAYNSIAELICISSVRVDELKNDFKTAKANDFCDSFNVNRIQKKSGDYYFSFGKSILIQCVFSNCCYLSVSIVAPNFLKSWKEKKNRAYLNDIEPKLKKCVEAGKYDLVQIDNEVYGNVVWLYFWLKYFPKRYKNPISNYFMKTVVDSISNRLPYDVGKRYVALKTTFFKSRKFLKLMESGSIDFN